MANKSIIIIGAGIAGLSAGVYGQMNGYETQIYELHTQPGGLCTAWKRQGYTIDGCIHWLVGSGSGGMNQMWRELGAVQNRKMVDHEEFSRVVRPDGKTLIVYTDIDRFERHLLELSPADKPVITEFTTLVRALTRFDSPIDKPQEFMNLLDMLKLMPKMMPAMKYLRKYGEVTCGDFAARFSDPFLRQVFPLVVFGSSMPLTGMAMTLAWLHIRNAGFPLGGSFEFSRAIEKRYLSLGGRVHYNARVEKILVEKDPATGKDRAVGIRLADGSEPRADVIISAADGRSTIFDMLEGKYADEETRTPYEQWPIFEPIVQVSLGVNRDLSKEPHAMIYALEKPVALAGAEQKNFMVKHYCYDPSLAPEGKSLVEVMLNSNHAYWKTLKDIDTERYEAEKQQVATAVIGFLEQKYPGLTGQIEMIDVATPLTYERYTGNWKGSFEGWQITTQTLQMQMQGKAMRKTLPGLENFYMIGQWVEPGGGLPTSGMSGRNLIYRLCHQDKKKFTAYDNSPLIPS